jgi:hypothetical protein
MRGQALVRPDVLTLSAFTGLVVTVLAAAALIARADRRRPRVDDRPGRVADAAPSR